MRRREHEKGGPICLGSPFSLYAAGGSRNNGRTDPRSPRRETGRLKSVQGHEPADRGVGREPGCSCLPGSLPLLAGDLASTRPPTMGDRYAPRRSIRTASGGAVAGALLSLAPPTVTVGPHQWLTGGAGHVLSRPRPKWRVAPTIKLRGPPLRTRGHSVSRCPSNGGRKCPGNQAHSCSAARLPACPPA